MINKQKLWFLTLFSLILVLSVYYLTMPNDALQSVTTSSTVSNGEAVEIEESEFLTALRVESDETVIKEMNELQDILLDEKASSEEKNNAFESLKDLNQNKGKEDSLEKKVLEVHQLKSFIKITGDQIKVVVDGKKHDKVLANKIIRTIQEEFDKQMFITVKFQS